MFLFDLFFIINEKLKFFLLERNIKIKYNFFKKMFPIVSTKFFDFNFKNDKIQGKKIYYNLKF